MKHWILDGYNIIRQVDFLEPFEQKSLAEGRKRLLEFLARFFKEFLSNKGEITVVFDGSENGLPFEKPESVFEGIKILFSQGRKADQVIEELIIKSTNPKNVIVVSADREVKLFARKNRCASITPTEFVNMAFAPKKERTRKPVLSREGLHRIEEELRKWVGLNGR